MIKKLAAYLTNRWKITGVIDPSYEEVYQYGNELLISSLIGASTIILIGSIFFSIISSLVFLAVFISLRSFCGGYHAPSYLLCNLVSCLSFIMVCLASRYIAVSSITITIVLVCIGIVLLLIAPVDNEKKPIEQQNRKKYKIVSLSIFGFLCVGLVALYNHHTIAGLEIFYTLVIIAFLAVAGMFNNKIKRKEI